MPVKSGEQHYLELFGKNIRRIRTEKELSMQQLANMADMELSQIYRIETGKINPKLSTIVNITHALQVSADELFKGIVKTED